MVHTQLHMEKDMEKVKGHLFQQTGRYKITVQFITEAHGLHLDIRYLICLLYTSDAADE